MKSSDLKFLFFCYISIINGQIIFVCCGKHPLNKVTVSPRGRWDTSYELPELPEVTELSPKIKAVNIRSDIQYRYAKTVVTSYIENPSVELSQEVMFSMILPETAFISNFIMKKKGKNEIIKEEDLTPDRKCID